jgi:hypothetical protein
MNLNGTLQKIKETKKKKTYASNNASPYFKTKTQLSKSKPVKTKQDSKSLVNPKTQKSIPLSSLGAKAKKESFQHGKPLGKKEKPTKQKSWEDKDWENEGWSEPRKVNTKEHLKFSKGFDSEGQPKISPVGRPKKSEQEKMNVKSIRLSTLQEKKFLKQARKEGFATWQSWIKKIAEERSQS